MPIAVLDINLLTLIVGLSVYVSSLRFLVLGRLMADPPPATNRKTSYKQFLRSLIPADLLFLVSGVSLFIYLYLPRLVPPMRAPHWLGDMSVWACFLGIIYLALHHAVSCWRSLNA